MQQVQLNIYEAAFVVVVTGTSVVLAQLQVFIRTTEKMTIELFYLQFFFPCVQVSDVKPGRNSGLIHLISCFSFLAVCIFSINCSYIFPQHDFGAFCLSVASSLL